MLVLGGRAFPDYGCKQVHSIAIGFRRLGRPLGIVLDLDISIGPSALLGSVTTPVNAPEVVVWASTSFRRETPRSSAENDKRIGSNLIKPPKSFDQANPRSAEWHDTPYR